MPRPPSADSVLKNMKKDRGGVVDKPPGVVIPNLSGDLSKGSVRSTPTQDTDVASKKYVDDNAGGAPEGTAVKSTGEGGTTKFLRTDGDGTCSWQVPSYTSEVNDLSAAVTWANVPDANITETSVTQHVAAIDHDSLLNFAANEHFTEASINHANITAGDGSDHADVAANTAARHAESHTMASHSDDDTYNISTSGTAATGALTVTGNIAVTGTVDGVDIAARDHAESHTVASHSDTSGTGAELNTLTDNSMADTLHRHSELSASDGTPDAALTLSATGVPTHTTDMDTNDTLFIPNIWHGTDSTPPAANTCPRGTLYVQYTA